jgi:O-antigen biosynthesis protein
MITIVKKIIASLAKDGIYVTFRKLKNKIQQKRIYSSTMAVSSFELNPNLLLPEKMKKLINPPADKRMVWFVPEFSEGSGGHRTILRHISYYEQQGLYSDVYLFYQNLWGDTVRTRKNLIKYFDTDLKHCNFFELTHGEVDSQVQREYSIAMATSWESAYIVANFSKCYKKAYFVQDFEPYFFAKGSYYHFAENTYRFKFDLALTAGDWLKTILEKEYGIPAVSFGFGYDDKIYYPTTDKKNSNVKTIFYYARPITDRRGFELAIHVLYTLIQKRKDIRIITAGWDLSDYGIPFVYEDHKKVTPEQLASLYRESDVALVISLTNLSLLPYEVAATGCPVLMNDGPNTEWIDPAKEFFFFSKPTVNTFVSTLEYIIDNPKETAERMTKLNEYLKTISWETEIRKCYNVISS